MLRPVSDVSYVRDGRPGNHLRAPVSPHKMEIETYRESDFTGLLSLPPELIWLIVLALDGISVLTFREVHSYVRDAYRDNDFLRRRAQAYHGRPTKRTYHWGHILYIRRVLDDRPRQDAVLGDHVDLTRFCRTGWPNAWRMAWVTYKMGGCTKLNMQNVRMNFIPLAVYKMPCLKVLDVSGNLLTHLKLSFYGPLKRLIARNNRMVSIETSNKVPKSVPVQRIRCIDVSGNHLAEFPWRLLVEVQGLRSLHIEQQRWGTIGQIYGFALGDDSFRKIGIRAHPCCSGVAALEKVGRPVLKSIRVHDGAAAERIRYELIQAGWSLAEADRIVFPPFDPVTDPPVFACFGSLIGAILPIGCWRQMSILRRLDVGWW